MTTNWVEWHNAYDDPTSGLVRRLAHVRRRVLTALRDAPAGEIRLISMCAGQGLDVFGAVAEFDRTDDVVGRLVELDPENVAAAKARGVPGIEIVEGDASVTSAYYPADVVLACGVFGNVSDEDVQRTVTLLPMLCRPGATVVWTRHHEAPDLTPSIREWFAAAGFEELGFDTEPGYSYSVGTHRLVGEPLPWQDTKLFDFVGKPFDGRRSPVS
ncbi:hypothetical protein [Kutzneria chonburiensis]|uniref:SAM-dependent methyltransferase n=1 Tax=Kutzneria chonburiensis TaxID=1483604 RepID=A0ABV6N9H6_9PSEU|nr:hypothetical protein [Kutzneria chonburiensis]